MISQSAFDYADNLAGYSQQVMDSLPIGLLFLNPNLQITAINSFFIEKLSETVKVWPNAPVQIILGEDKEQTIRTLRQTMSDGRPRIISLKFHKSLFLWRKDTRGPSTEMTLRVTAIPIVEAKTNTSLMVVLQDFTEQALVEDELRRELNKFALLHKFDLALSTLEINACMDALVTQLQKAFDTDFACLMVEQEENLVLKSSAGLPLPERTVAINQNAGLTGWVFQNKQPIRIGNVKKDTRYRVLFETINSEMAVPLIVGGECIGVIDLESNRPYAFSDADQKLLEMVAHSAANALNNARVHAEANYWRAYYKGVVNQSGDVIYTVDRDLRLTGANLAWDRFAMENGGQDWVSSNIVGRDLLSAFSGMEREKWRMICHELLAGSRSSYREDIPCDAPERERWMRLQVGPLNEGKGEISGLIFQSSDISEHVFAERRLRRLNDNLENLLRISQVLNMNLPNQNVSQITTEILAEVLQADCVTITQYDESEQAFKVTAATGASERHIQSFRSPSDQAGRIIGQYGTTGTVYDLMHSLSSDNLPIYRDDRLHSLLYSVIEHQGKTIGSLNIFLSDPRRRFSMEEIILVQSLAPQVGLAMENARLYDQLKDLATTDGLTGLSNRRYLDDLMATELSRSQRYGHKLTILMIDVDHFKCYNDTFGHQVGDDLLKKIARMFRNSIRTVDIAARYGGDEFVIILPETSLENATCIAHRFQGGMKQIEVASKEGVVCPNLTLSIGIAAYPDHATEFAVLLRCADQALYRSKQLGRNRVEIFDPGDYPVISGEGHPI